MYNEEQTQRAIEAGQLEDDGTRRPRGGIGSIVFGILAFSVFFAFPYIYFLGFGLGPAMKTLFFELPLAGKLVFLFDLLFLATDRVLNPPEVFKVEVDEDGRQLLPDPNKPPVPDQMPGYAFLIMMVSFLLFMGGSSWVHHLVSAQP